MAGSAAAAAAADDDRPRRRAPRILFTCTTYLSLPGKLVQCLRALASIKMLHSDEELGLVERFLLINEVPADAGADLPALVRGAFPWVEVVQKTADQRGQAASLNLILERLGGYDIWIHWEESWQCRRPFIAQASAVLETSDVTQLQISQDIWWGAAPARLATHHSARCGRWARVAPHPTFVELLPRLEVTTLPGLWREHGLEVIWPLYSLRPSVNRAAFYAQLAPFDTSPAMWPHLFEWEFGLRWFKAGGRKAISLPEAAFRQPRHRSTHAAAG